MATTNLSGYNGGGAYEGQRRQIENQYTQGSAQNAYGRFLSKQRGERNLGDMNRVFQRNYAPNAAQFGGRGLAGPGMNSGAMQQTMGRYIGDYTRDRSRAAQDLTQDLQGYDLDQTMRDAWRQEALANIELDRYSNIANTAQNLQALRSWLGGI